MKMSPKQSRLEHMLPKKSSYCELYYGKYINKKGL